MYSFIGMHKVDKPQPKQRTVKQNLN